MSLVEDTIAEAKAERTQNGMYLQYPIGLTGGDTNSSQIDDDDNTLVVTAEGRPKFPHSVVFTLLARQQSSSPASNLITSTSTGRQVAKSSADADRAPTEHTPGKIAAVGAGLGGAATLLNGLQSASSLKNFLTGLGLGALGGALTQEAGQDAVTDTLAELDELASRAADYLAPKDEVLVTEKLIRLYIPQSPSEQFNAGWVDTELGTLAGMANDSGSAGLLQTVINDIKAIASGSDSVERGGATEFLARKLAGTAAGALSSLGFNFNIDSALELSTGRVPNPYKEQLFKSMSFRGFAFQFKFVPKNRTELENVYQIMDVFRRNMHPKAADQGFFFIYPNLFRINYQYNSNDNKFLTKIADCALTDMKVDYGSGGAFTTIKGTYGAPTEITMTLNFKELKLLTREFFNGWGPNAVTEAQNFEESTSVRDDINLAEGLDRVFADTSPINISAYVDFDTTFDTSLNLSSDPIDFDVDLGDEFAV